MIIKITEIIQTNNEFVVEEKSSVVFNEDWKYVIVGICFMLRRWCFNHVEKLWEIINQQCSFHQNNLK